MKKYFPEFKELQKYEKVQNELLESLDSVFINTKAIVFSREDNIDSYLIRKSDTFSQPIHPKDRRLLNYTAKNILFNELYFDKDYHYVLNDLGNPALKNKDTNKIKYAGRVITNKTIERYQKILKENKNKVFYYNISNTLKINTSLKEHLVFNNFILKGNISNQRPPIRVNYSIIKEPINARHYFKSIVENDFFNSINLFKESTNQHLFVDVGESIFPLEGYEKKPDIQTTADGDPYNDYIFFEDSYVREYSINNSVINNFATWSSKIDTLYITNDTINNISFNGNKFEPFIEEIPSFNSKKTEFKKGSFSYDNTKLPHYDQWQFVEIYDSYSENIIIDVPIKSLDLIDLEVKNKIIIAKEIDSLVLFNVKYDQLIIYKDPLSEGKSTKIFFDEIDVEKLEINWKGFELYVPKIEGRTNELLNANYLKLIEKFKKQGLDESLEVISKQYKSWNYIRNGKYLTDWIQKRWWDYGYDKSLIIYNTFYIFILYSLINCLFLKYLSKKVYLDKKIHAIAVKTTKTKWWIFQTLLRIPASLFYTSRLFFGFGFKYDKLRYKDKLLNFKLLILLYVFVIFLSGLVCMGYILNYVLNL